MAIKKKTAPKAAKPRKTATPPKAPATAAAPKPATQTTTIRRKEMVERIVATTGKKPNEVKSVLDGVLMELGKALSAGENLNLHPLGKITVNRQKSFDDREIIVCKIRRKIEAELPMTDMKTAAE